MVIFFASSLPALDKSQLMQWGRSEDIIAADNLDFAAALVAVAAADIEVDKLAAVAVGSAAVPAAGAELGRY